MFTIHNGQIYTSPVILGAEAILLDLARDTTGPTIAPATIHTAGLSADKAAALRRIATSGQKLEALIGPAGTGKTSLLSALTASWEARYGDGSIIALAPSSAASTVLSDAIGTPTENIAKWIYESAGLGAEQRREQILQTEHAAALAHRARRRLRHQRLIAQLAALRAEHDRWSFHKNQLVIIDEASMASTMELATLARATNSAGAKLLLVGDDAQLCAADTGGAFRLIARDTEAAELTDVWRFTNPWERDASLALRRGELTAIDMYDDHNRLTAGSSAKMEDAAYKAWLADTNNGKTSLLIAADNTTVARLNARARLDRITTGEVEPDGIELHNGNHVGLGDHIVTRLNNRRLRYGQHQFVKNGDHWTVIQRWPDGSLTVQNQHRRHRHPPQQLRPGIRRTRLRHHSPPSPRRHRRHRPPTRHRTTHPSPDVRRHDPRPRHQQRLRRHPPDDARTSTNPTPNKPCKTSSKPSSTTPASNNPPTKSCAKNSTTPPASTGSSPSTNTSANSTPRSATNPPSPPPASTQPTKQHSKPPPPTAPSSPSSAAPKTPASTSPTYSTTPSTNHRCTNAHDLAAVIHHRVHRLTARSLHKTGRTPHKSLGLVTPAIHVSDPTLIAPLRELESQIIDRANWLAEELLANPPAWYRNLRHVAGEPPDQELAELAREIAAYRERYRIHGHSILGDTPPTNADVRRHQHARLMRMITGFSPEAVERSIDGTGIAEASAQSVQLPQPD